MKWGDGKQKMCPRALARARRDSAVEAVTRQESAFGDDKKSGLFSIADEVSAILLKGLVDLTGIAGLEIVGNSLARSRFVM